MIVEQPQVGRNALPALDRDDVAGDEFLGVHFDGGPVAQHGRADAQQLLQALALLLGVPLLPAAEDRVHEQHDRR